MGQEFDTDDFTETSDQLRDRLEALDERRGQLAGGRDVLATERQQLAPVEAYVATKNEVFKGRARIQDAEEKAIAREAAGLRREIASTRKAAAAAQKQRLKDLVGEHEAQLGDLDNVAENLADFQKAGPA